MGFRPPLSLLALLLHSSAQAEVLETAIIHLISIYLVTRAQLSQTGLYSRTGDEEDGFPQSSVPALASQTQCSLKSY